MRQRADALAAAGVEAAVVTFYGPETVAAYRRELGLPFPCLADPERRVYRLYGLEGGSLPQLFHPSVLSAYLRLLLQGQRLRAPGGDVRQLGGDFIVDPGGRLALAHYSRTPADRPDVGALLAACGSRAPSGAASGAGGDLRP